MGFRCPSSSPETSAHGTERRACAFHTCTQSRTEVRPPVASGCSGVTGRACMFADAFKSTLSCQGTASSAGCAQSLRGGSQAGRSGTFVALSARRGGRGCPAV